jgi:hypothetical protein
MAPARAAPPQPVVIDRVIATVNDSAIMQSELETVAAGAVRTHMAQYGRLSRADIDRIYWRELQKLIDRHTMAQAAKTFGVYSPEQVEMIFRQQIERQEQDQVRDLGSYQAFSQALQNQGRTWQTYMREQRVDKMADLAEELSVYSRLQRQSNLYLTPRMLRETYYRERGHFVRDAQARVARVSFSGPDAQTRAEQAAEVWRTEDLTNRELARRFPPATGIDEVDARVDISDVGPWALQGPAGNVSAPAAVGDTYQIAKVTAFAPARNGRFEDVEVQNELRRMCQVDVIEEFRKQALERARLRTEVWVAPWLERGRR